jgi:hypothetical protein
VGRAARCHVRRDLARTQREVRIGAKQQLVNSNLGGAMDFSASIKL